MSLKYTTSLFRLTNSHKLYSCLQSRTFCEDSSHKTNNHIGSETKLGMSKKDEEEKATSEKLKMEEVLKSLSQKSASRSSQSTGKNEKKRSYTDNVADKKSKKHSTDIKSDFFASLKEGKRRVSLDEGLEKSDKNADEAKLKMAELLKSFTKESLHSGNRIPLSQPKPRKKMPNTKTESVIKDPILDLSLNKAVKDVANEFNGDPNEIESDLFASLKSHSAETSLSELLATMKIDRSPPKPSPTSTKPYKDSSQKLFGRFKDDNEEIHPRSRLNDFRRPEFKKEFRKHTPTDLNSGTPLNIFSEDYKGEGDTSILATWELIAERDKKVAVTNFPRNAWEEMIQWTEEGKIWTFPIDNEIGLEEEKKYGFADHIFLEHHLEEWCPKKGPIRRYMDLVCTGLSKNPFLTVERKKAHIKWYQNYFEEKKLLLKELGAM